MTSCALVHEKLGKRGQPPTHLERHGTPSDASCASTRGETSSRGSGEADPLQHEGAVSSLDLFLATLCWAVGTVCRGSEASFTSLCIHLRRACHALFPSLSSLSLVSTQCRRQMPRTVAPATKTATRTPQGLMMHPLSHPVITRMETKSEAMSSKSPQVPVLVLSLLRNRSVR